MNLKFLNTPLARSLLTIIFLISAAGCGTMHHISNPTGELYLGTRINMGFFDRNSGSSEGSFVTAPPGLILLAGVATIIDIPISLVSGTILIPRDLYLGQKNGINLTVLDERGVPVPGVTVKFRAKSTHEKKTDENGNVRINVKWDEIDFLQIKKDGFYYTVEYSRSYPDLFENEFKNTEKRNLTCEIRTIRNPVPMKEQEFFSLKIPSDGKSYGIDLLKKDLVGTGRRGEHADIIISFQRPNESNRWGSYEMMFPGEGNGLYRWDVLNDEKVRYSQFKFPYSAPVTGYLKTKTEADKEKPKKFKRKHPSDYENYIFQIRSDQPYGPYVGKIVGFVRVDVDFDRSYHLLDMTYFINETGTRSLEHVIEEK